jgi:hypothetical protein
MWNKCYELFWYRKVELKVELPRANHSTRGVKEKRVPGWLLGFSLRLAAARRLRYSTENSEEPVFVLPLIGTDQLIRRGQG